MRGKRKIKEKSNTQKIHKIVTVKSNNTQYTNFLLYTNTYLAFVGL